MDAHTRNLLNQHPVFGSNTYAKILEELSVKTGTTKGGRPIAFDVETYIKIIHLLEYGHSFEDIITAGIIKRNSLYDYKRKSPTFSNVIARAKGTTTKHALVALTTAIRYIPEHIKIVRNLHGKTKQIVVPEKKADLPSARWWLSHEREARKRFNTRAEKDT